MNNVDAQYLAALKQIRDTGIVKENRTGIKTRALFGMQIRYNLEEGFPILTTKRIAFNVVKGELLGFIRGYSSAAQFREVGVNIWDANANENMQWLRNPNREGDDDLGRIYGVQWRDWQSCVEDRNLDWGHLCIGHVDQLAEVIQNVKTVMENPSDSSARRLIVTAWNPEEIDQMALPPCHMFFQLNVRGEYLDLQMYQRSCDFFLGVAFNITSYSLLLSMIASVCGLKPGEFVHTMADAHIYENHLDAVEIQLSREGYVLPKLLVNPDVRSIDDFELEDIGLLGYEHHPSIAAPMAV